MKKRNKERVEIEEGKEYVGKTIVGGRPLRRPKRRISIPVGIEKVLYKAAVDPLFKKLLLADRMKAVELEKMRLSPSEMLIFRNVSDSALRTMIGKIRPKKHGRRKLMKAVAAAVVTLTAGTAGVGCDDGGPSEDAVEDDIADVQDIMGDTADMPNDLVDIPDDSAPDTMGDLADIPDDLNDTVDIDEDDWDAAEGARPDMPDVEDLEEDREDADAEDALEDDVQDADGEDALDDPAGDDAVDEDAAGDAGDAEEDLSEDPAEEG